MKISYRVLVFIGLLFVSAVPAYAQQFTLLPATNKTVEECKTVLDKFEATGTVPKASDVAQTDYLAANKADDAAASALDSAQANADKATKPEVCSSSPSDPSCSDYNNAQKQLADAQKKKTDADAKKNAAYDKVMEATVGENPDERSTLLGCGIKTGRISFNMIPYFITYVSNYLLGLVGLVSVFFVVLGGYQYVLGGLTEDKEKGKNTIFHALLGLGVALLSWIAVSVVIAAITG